MVDAATSSTQAKQQLPVHETTTQTQSLNEPTSPCHKPGVDTSCREANDHSFLDDVEKFLDTVCKPCLPGVLNQDDVTSTTSREAVVDISVKDIIREACEAEDPNINSIQSEISKLLLAPEVNEYLLFINNLLLSTLENDQPEVAFAICEVLVKNEAVDDLYVAVESNDDKNQKQALDKIDKKVKKNKKDKSEKTVEQSAKEKVWMLASKLLGIKVEKKVVLDLWCIDDGCSDKKSAYDTKKGAERAASRMRAASRSKSRTEDTNTSIKKIRVDERKVGTSRLRPGRFALKNLSEGEVESTTPIKRTRSSVKFGSREENKDAVEQDGLKIPRGFESKSDYIDWRITCLKGIGKTKHPNMKAFLQGSAVALESSDDKTSAHKKIEFEIALADKDLFKALKKDKDAKMERKNLTLCSFKLKDWNINPHGLRDLEKTLRNAPGGRTISLRVFESSTDAKAFAPSEKLV